MKPISLGKFIVALLVGLLILPEIANAATEYATFESFYHQPSITIWILAGATVFAVIAGAVIFFTGGAASPLVVSAGTWVGGLMGYSGIAATNAGLALLGGGSIVYGGLGMAGGVALLTAALTFSTTMVIDYSVSTAMNSYNYSKFVNDSRKMTTLPLPRNDSGSDAYEDAIKVLKDINSNESLFSGHNQTVIKDAIKKIETSRVADITQEENAREQSLLALLYFTSNDYVMSRKYAADAYALASGLKGKATLPAFIFATTSLYEEKPDFQKTLDYFNYAVTNESANPLTPLLYAIYLDRVMYRFNDGALPYSALDKIFALSESLQSDQRKTVIRLGLQNRYFTAIKIEQQKILSLAKTINKTIKDSPKTLATVKAALNEYKLLLSHSREALDKQTHAVAANLNRDNGTIAKLRGRGIEKWEMETNQQLVTLNTLWLSYSNNAAELEGVVRELEQYQAKLERTRKEAKSKQGQPSGIAANDNKGGVSWWIYLSTIAAMLLIGIFLFRRRNAS